MGAQTLEILRQGVWASLAGGWFYDPHQNIFCNTVHFYIFIFLVSLPFTIYLYFPLSFGVYLLYCGCTTVLFALLKFMNHALHYMFDTSVCIQESVPLDHLPESQRKRAVAVQTTKSILEEEGIELQVLKTAEAAIHDPTDDDSVNSVEAAAKQASSTIDLKVDVHRKNSSESCEEARSTVEYNVAPEKHADSPGCVSESSPVIVHKDPLCCKETEKGRTRTKESKKRRCGLVRNLSAESSQADIVEPSASGGSYDIGITANGSCGVLPQAQVVILEQMKNTGSLELPLKESDVTPTSDKGLLYWKQHKLEPSTNEKLRKVENVILPVCSETSIASTSSVAPPTSVINSGSCETLTKAEEVADWEVAGSLITKYKSDDNVNQTMPSLKFQLNSDEDSSDNAGSRSPLLCRHESLEKPKYLPADEKTTKSCPSVGKTVSLTVYQDAAKSAPEDLARWTSGTKKGSSKRESFLQGGKKLSLPMDASYDVDVRRSDKMPGGYDVDNRSNKIPVYDVSNRRGEMVSGYDGDGRRCGKMSEYDVDSRRNDKMTGYDVDSKRVDKLSSDVDSRRCDMVSWGSERVGLDWLFEHTDSETDCSTVKLAESMPGSSQISLESVIPSTSGAIQSHGAIPKTQVAKKTHRGHRSGRSKRSSHFSLDDGELEWRERKKQKNERENGIIDEEDPSTLWVEARKSSLDEKEHLKSADWREGYDSSSGSANELSSLLPLSSLLSSLHPPSSPLLAAFLATRRELPNAPMMPGIDDGTATCLKTPRPDDRHYGPQRLEGVRDRHRRAKRSGRGHRSSPWSSRPMVTTPSSPFYVLSPNTHIAASYNDTSQGAIHCFQDERGNWWSYTFDATGTASTMHPLAPNISVVPQGGSRKPPAVRKTSETWDSNINLVSNSNSETEGSLNVSPRLPRVMNVRNNSVSTNSSVVLINDTNNNAAEPTQRTGVQIIVENLARIRPNSRPAIDPEILNRYFHSQQRPVAYLQPPRAKNNQYYKFYYTPWHFFKVRFDRLELIAVLDRNLTLFENFLSLLLSVLVSICGILLLSYGFYRDLLAFLLCLTIAGCHYSLLKSVQPDASSPTHGFNRLVIYSRSIYFCIISGVIMGLTALLESGAPSLVLYSVPITHPRVIRGIRDLLTMFILFFPLLFTIGLFPQINTFALYLLEQIDIHIFGGNASCSLIGAVYCLARSLLAVCLLMGFAYGALCEEKQSQHILFSIFCALVVTCSYHLSRCSSDPTVLWTILKDEFREKPAAVAAAVGDEGGPEEFVDPLPGKLKQTVHGRLINDAIVCCFVAILVFGIHCSAVFTTLQPDLNKILCFICGCSGLALHYLLPQLRKQLPWLCLSRPVFRSHEHGLFEVREAAKVMWFEEMMVLLGFVERNVLYPVLVLSTLTQDAPRIAAKFGLLPGALLTATCGLKVMRVAFSSTPHQYLVVVFAALLFAMDYRVHSETFLIDYFFVNILFCKVYEFLLKVQFVVTYIAPWQITWGSAFHAFAQPFAVPHSAMLFVQAAISAVLSAPLNPFLGSAIFLVSYVRPVKFWERDYNTKRVDQSNTRLSSHLDRNLGSDDNNLNSIFYEHLTRSLQHSLCGDLHLGRWGAVSQGDCFVLASDYLNCLVHIIEMGNGLVTFQMRGLEFRGTYCQQREVEAISEGVEENEGCCCCEPGHMPHMLSVNAAFSQRWLAWEVTATNYVLEGYSISDNSAGSMLQVFDFRKVLVTYYVKGIIWYCVRSQRLDEWLSTPTLLSALQNVSERTFVDLDPVFNVNIDQDFDFRAEGITRSSFCAVYLEWIQYCALKREKPIDKSRDSPLVSLCLALSLMGRRALGTASHNTVSSVEFFLYGLHALFKGDFRITSLRDEWVFSDMELLKRVVAPAVRMSLKLHQDHFMSPEEYEENKALYLAMKDHDANLVISHEGDPAWRSAVLSGTPSLLALRHVLDDGADEYKVIMLNKRFLSFRVIKLNRECVRGLWAGQQQELVFLRNRNPERGSIQNAKQALRNMINSSCDQPIGYPIYVSPLTTSYMDTNSQLTRIIGGSLSLQGMRATVLHLWQRVRQRCRQGCSSGGSVSRDDNHYSFGHDGVYAMTHINVHSGYGHSTSGSQSMDSSQMQLSGSNRGGSLGRSSLSGRSSFPGGKPSSATLVSLAGLLSSGELGKGDSLLRERETSFTSVREQKTREECCRKEDKRRERKEEMGVQRVRIVDPMQVFDAINLGRRIDVLWPDEAMRARGGRSYWKDWLPDTGMEGLVVHRWTPNHRDPGRRSHVDKTIVLVKVGERYVPIAETGVQELSADPTSQD